MRQRETELEQMARLLQQAEHNKAELEKTRDLTKLRQAQQRKLLEHDRLHRADESEKMAMQIDLSKLAIAQREELQRTRIETMYRSLWDG